MLFILFLWYSYNGDDIMSTIHIDADKEDIANLVIMPGDPLRAKFIAEEYLDN